MKSNELKKTGILLVLLILAVNLCWSTGVQEETGGIVQTQDAKGNPVTVLTDESFANPPISDWPWVRWNYDPETAEIGELEKELEDMFYEGIGGVEIGQGGPPTFSQLAAILRKANQLGIKVSLKYVDGAPVSGTYSKDEDYVRKMIDVSDVLVPAGDTFNGDLKGEGTIIAVLAYRATGIPDEEDKIITLDPDTVTDLSKSVTGKNTEGFFRWNNNRSG